VPGDKVKHILEPNGTEASTAAGGPGVIESRSNPFAVLAMLAQIMAQGEQEHKREHFSHYRVKDLGTLGGSGTNSAAYDMNNAGWVAGSSNLTAGGPQHAFLWYGGGHLKDLGTLDGSACPACNSEAGGLTRGARRRLFPRLPRKLRWARTFAVSAPTFNASGRSGEMAA
jgi:probable HAF family extracellular repeat protein